MSLKAADFVDFFRAMYNRSPFPWQARLATTVCEEGGWPDVLDLPTGTGKTTAIDIAVFHLACEAHEGANRRAAVRILFVIDRRIVVDATYEHARKIAERLAQPGDNPVLKKVAASLALLSGNERSPLRAVRLRGGVPLEPAWARTASQPLVCVSTVDQAGSRLLFRGYGVSRKMWPVHAGLVGSDALWLLDEAHLAEPLVQTLQAIREGHPQNGDAQAWLGARPRLAPFGIVRLSATPGEIPGKRFSLDEKDRANEVLRRRLSAPKPARLETGDPVSVCSTHALEAAGLKEKPSSRPAGAVGVVVNRVNTAREIYNRLCAETEDLATVSLLIGPCRPVEREDKLRDLLPRLAAGRDRSAIVGKPDIVVATQTIEVGADLDFDALVSEIAPLDSLRQRFGRLDRLGEFGDARAWIVASETAISKNADEDRVYEDRLPKVWKWLQSEASSGKKPRMPAKEQLIDFRISAMDERLRDLGSRLLELIAPRRDAPVLFPPYAALWSMTSPPPTATPEPSLFLHGPERPADVTIVWRADADSANVVGLEACPPSALEAMQVPIGAVKAWLRNLPPDPVADVSMRTVVETGESPSEIVPLRRNESTDRWEGVSADRIRPGNLIVVPAGFGGCDHWGWNPTMNGEVLDLGDRANERQRGKLSVRLTKETLANALPEQARKDAAQIWTSVASVLEDLESGAHAGTIAATLAEIDGLPEDWTRRLKEMKGRALDLRWYDEESPAAGIAVFTRWRIKQTEEPDSEEATTEREDSAHTGREVRLKDHSGDVSRAAEEDARRAGLPESVVQVLKLAGLVHDFGKADPRFQAELYGAPRAYREGSEPLAKSRHPYRSRSGRQGFAPVGFRHEALSVALAQGYPKLASLSDDDRDLLLWLVGTHHGYGRPFFPACVDPHPETPTQLAMDGSTAAAQAKDAPVRLDQGWPEIADRVRRRWGPWELARLEAILRLADHRVSAREQERKDPHGTDNA